MKIEIKTTITDLPRKGKEEQDKFGLGAYEKGLETFLRGASTPITIAFQGEWGSGKTSLMNVLRDNLCGDNDSEGSFFPIWINTWEYSMMRDSNDALIQIILRMTSEIVSLSQNTNRDVINKIANTFAAFGTAITRNVANKMVLPGIGDAVAEVLTNTPENSIADLRKHLQQQINDCLNQNKEKKGFIFFIDDLDRIDPPVAVELLELLKNIFTLEHCIFVLAIDYDVVIKGLKPKFGELNEKNEREFRSFFDKIIQVPFSMPVSQYSTKNYLIVELKKIGVLDSADSSDKSLVNKINKAESLTVGPNPRSIKRFLNTLSLIKCINNARKDIGDNESETEKETEEQRKLTIFLNLVIVGIQVAYPKVYQLLCFEPGFTMWDDSIASKMGLPKIDEQIQERLKKFNEFDETWELVLYRLCQTDRYLQNNAINISQLLNMVRNSIEEVSKEDLEEKGVQDEEHYNRENDLIKEYVQDQMSQTSITGFSAGDSTKLEYNRGQLMRTVQRRLLQYVSNHWKDIKFRGPKVKFNGGINTEGNYPNLKIWQDNPAKHKIKFAFRISSKSISQNENSEFMPESFPTKDQNDNIRNLEQFAKNPLFSEFFEKCKDIESYECYYLQCVRQIRKDGKLLFDLGFDVKFDTPEAFLEERSIKMMQEITRIFFDIVFKIQKLK